MGVMMMSRFDCEFTYACEIAVVNNVENLEHFYHFVKFEIPRVGNLTFPGIFYDLLEIYRQTS